MTEALLLVEQLAVRDDSHLSAALMGGLQFVGWTQDRMLAAATRDLIAMVLAGLGGTKLPETDLWPRPARPEVAQAATIAEFDTGAFMRMLAT